MSEYVDMLLIAVITIYIVDLSGFTDSWREAVARWLKVKDLKPIRPFDCSRCMIWWACIIYSLIMGVFSLPVLAYIASLSFLANPMMQICIFLYEGIICLVNKMMKWYE